MPFLRGLFILMSISIVFADEALDQSFQYEINGYQYQYHVKKAAKAEGPSTTLMISPINSEEIVYQSSQTQGWLCKNWDTYFKSYQQKDLRRDFVLFCAQNDGLDHTIQLFNKTELVAKLRTREMPTITQTEDSLYIDTYEQYDVTGGWAYLPRMFYYPINQFHRFGFMPVYDDFAKARYQKSYQFYREQLESKNIGFIDQGWPEKYSLLSLAYLSLIGDMEYSCDEISQFLLSRLGKKNLQLANKTMTEDLGYPRMDMESCFNHLKEESLE